MKTSSTKPTAQIVCRALALFGAIKNKRDNMLPQFPSMTIETEPTTCLTVKGALDLGDTIFTKQLKFLGRLQKQVQYEIQWAPEK
jgi:hypothetical protein